MNCSTKAAVGAVNLPAHAFGPALAGAFSVLFAGMGLSGMVKGQGLFRWRNDVAAIFLSPPVVIPAKARLHGCRR